jgi:CyaY protein
MEFDDDSKIIVNGNTPLREIWVAAKAGGFHYRLHDGRWTDTRSGDELFAALSRLVSQQSGTPVRLGPGAPPA